jgi:inward rectifier potassium channel
LGLNVIFACIYYLCGPGTLDGASRLGEMPRFLDSFFFSVQTFATIGYGRITPIGIAANLLVTLEALCGLLWLALATGLLFARFSKPTARVIFSNSAIITNHDGVPSFIFRIANARLNQIVEAQISVALTRNEFTSEGEKYRNFYDLKLERSRSPVFAMTWTIVHPITLESPIFQMDRKALEDAECEIMVSVSGIDDTFSQTIHARFSYVPSQLVWDRHFEDMLTRTGQGKVRVDLSKIHQFRLPEQVGHS